MVRGRPFHFSEPWVDPSPMDNLKEALYLLDLFGTLVFAITGAFKAVKHELDLLGVMTLALATGIGGGMIRDVILGYTPVAALRDPLYFVIPIAGALIVFIAAHKIVMIWRYVMISDALGLAVFTAIGAAKGAEYHLGFFGVILAGVLTATGGGVVRDILVRELPVVIHADFYATAAIIGSALYYCMDYMQIGNNLSLPAVIAVTTLVRLVAMRYRLSLPKKSLPEE